MSAIPEKVKHDTEVHKRSAVIDKSPLALAAANIALMFKEAKSIEDFKKTEDVWIHFRKKLTDYETQLECKRYGESGDTEIAASIIDELIGKPISLYLSIIDLLASIIDKDDSDYAREILDLKNIFIDISKEIASESAENAIKKLGPAAKKLRELLLNILQSYSKRSRKYFVQIIDDIVAIVIGSGSLAWRMAKLLAPSGISPEACGNVVWVERERSEAVSRVFKITELSQSPLKIPSPSTSPKPATTGISQPQLR